MDCDAARWTLWERGAHAGGELSEHLASCESCGSETRLAELVRSALAAAPGEEPPLIAPLELPGAERPEPACSAPGEILTPQELAGFLKVPLARIYAELSELPAFEFAGQVRFRLKAIEEWLEQKERDWRRQALAGRLRLDAGRGV